MLRAFSANFNLFLVGLFPSSCELRCSFVADENVLRLDPLQKMCNRLKLSAHLKLSWNKTETKPFWNCFETIFQFHFICADCFR